MPVQIQLQMKGRGPRALQPKINAARKEAWQHVATYFHAHMRDKRFTPEHAQEANYIKRRGENLSRGSKAFRASYTGRKLRMFGHTRPLEFTGATRAAVRRASIKAFTLKCQLRYQGANKFNFRNAKSQIRMGEEFRRVLPREATELAQEFNNHFDQQLWRMKDQ